MPAASAFLTCAPLIIRHIRKLPHNTSTPRTLQTRPRGRQAHFHTHPIQHVSKMTADYTIYYAPTPNGKKITLAAEEMGLNYKVEPVRFSSKDQFKPEFLKINPNSKIPALVDHTATGGDLAVFESGAILEYLAEKTGKLLPPASDIRRRTAVKQWLYWQMAGFGPMLGQAGFFFKFAKEDIPAGKERYLNESIRLFGVLDKQLSENKFVAGDEYSIADISIYWWSIAVYDVDEIKEHFEKFENVKRWQKKVAARPAVEKAKAVEF